MDINIYKSFIHELIVQGIKVQDLTLMQISYSLSLYKKLRGIKQC